MVPLDLEKAEPTEEHGEIAFYPPMCQSIPNLPRKPGPDEMVVYKVTQQSARAEVVKRDDDVLTPQEVKDNWKEVSEAMLKELQTWAKLTCFSREPRSQARNIIDTRGALKFKWEQPTTSAASSGYSKAQTAKKTIRARLTVRGFKTVEKQMLKDTQEQVPKARRN